MNMKYKMKTPKIRNAVLDIEKRIDEPIAIIAIYLYDLIFIEKTEIINERRANLPK